MANPVAITSLTQMFLKSYIREIGTGDTYFTYGSDNSQHKLINCVCCNYSTSSVTVTASVEDGSGSTYTFAKDFTIPAKSNLILVSKDNPIVFEYSSNTLWAERFKMTCSANSSVNVLVTEERWTDQ